MLEIKWGNIIKALQAKGFKPRILYQAKMAFDIESKIRTCFDTEATKAYFLHPSFEIIIRGYTLEIQGDYKYIQYVLSSSHTESQQGKLENKTPHFYLGGWTAKSTWEVGEKEVIDTI